MATGPDNYRAAEKILADVTSPSMVIYNQFEQSLVAARIAAAQVHATLALAAATALAPSGIPADGATARDWRNMLHADTKAD